MVTCTKGNKVYIYNSACYSLKTVGIYGFGENYTGCFSVQKEFTFKTIPDEWKSNNSWVNSKNKTKINYKYRKQWFNTRSFFPHFFFSILHAFFINYVMSSSKGPLRLGFHAKELNDSMTWILAAKNKKNTI